MPKETFHYSNDDITVVWKPHVCQHSTLCWKGLIQVFNPQKKPWVNIDAADSERIIEQVKICPSGALSYFMNRDKPGE
ncbi:MAG: (4Fe-4S)-binding protein [Terrimonas sp.]|nr:(4Fe-4S)-binding protein [Terrimonas sp.]